MTTTPTEPTTMPVNQVATATDTFIKDIEAILQPMLVTYLDAQVPALGLPVISTLVDGILAILEDKLTSYIETGSTFLIIDTQTALERWSMSNALLNLMNAERSGDQNAIAAAIVFYQQAQSSLVTDDGSAPPQ